MTTPVNFRVKNGLTVANGVAVTQGNVVITNGSLVIGGTAVNSSFINTAADNAYANGVNYTNGKAADAYGNAVAVATDLTNNAYSNAVTFAANATNLTNGTLPLERLPATVNISSALNVTNTVNITTSNVTVSQGNDVATMTGTVISLTDSLTETGNTYYAAVSHDKLITEKTYSVANVIYADYGEISRTGMFAVVGLDTTNSSIYVRGVTVNTSVIAIGNTTVFSTINSTAMVGNGALLTSVNAATVGGNSATDLRTYTETYASNATNITSGTVNSARLPAANATVAGAVVLVNSTSNTSTTAAASASSVKTAFDAAGSAYTNAVSYTDSAIGAANTAITSNAATAYTNAIAIAANATNLTSGTVNIARIPTVDAINNTSVSFVATANSVKTAYDAAIAANTNAASALANAATAYTNAIAIAANADNITSGTVNSARLPSGNSSVAGAVVLVDSVSNTSTTAAASAASVKTAYDAAITANTNAQTALTAAGAAYTNAVSYTDTKIGTANTAMVANAAAAYTNAVSYVDGKINTANAAITGNAATAYTNAVSYTDTKIGTANTAMVANASAAYTNAVSYTDTKIGTANTAMVANASAAYTNAITIAANATNLTSGTVAFARLPTVDSVANTSVALVPTANNVKTAYDAAITANTSAASAYTNAVSYTDTKIGTANTAMAANAAAAYTNAVSYTDTKIGTANTAMVANAAAAYTNATVFAANASNANNGTLAEARLPFRMNQNLRTSDSVSFANGSFTGSVSVGGDLTITGNLISTNVQSLTVTDPLIKLGFNNPGDTYWGGFTFHYSGSGNTTNHAGLVRSPTTKEFILMSTFGDETAVANNNTINIADPTFSYANLTVNILKSGNATVFSTINATSFDGTANNSTNFGGLSLATVQGQITGNAATAYTNAIAIAANGSNISSGTVAFARLPTVYLGTTAIQSTSAAQAVSGITTLAAGNTTISGFANVISGLSLSNGTSNFITWSTAGVEGPSINTRSPGTKLLLYPSLSASQSDYAMGIAAATMWSSVPSAEDSFKFKWFGADIDVASISGAGNFRTVGYANVGGAIQGGSSLTIAGAASGITTLAAGNTTITGFANVTSTLAAGNTTITGFANVSGNMNAATITYSGSLITTNTALYTAATGSTIFGVGSAIVSANTQGGRTYEGSHNFNSYPNLYTSIFINPGSATNLPTGLSGNAYRFVMGAGDVANRGFDLVGTGTQLFYRARESGDTAWYQTFTTSGGTITGVTTLSANIVMANNAITRPVLAGYTEHEVSASATGSYTLDCGAANFWDLTLTGNITIAPTNIPPSTRMWAGTIVAKQDATGGRTITWPTGSKYPGGVVPPATTTANAIDIWSLMTYDGGTSWIVSLTVKGAA